MIFGQTLKFLQQDAKNFDHAFLTAYGRQQVKKADQLRKQSDQIELNQLHWDWLKIDQKHEN